jgi:hypothetical protein
MSRSSDPSATRISSIFFNSVRSKLSKEHSTHYPHPGLPQLRHGDAIAASARGAAPRDLPRGPARGQGSAGADPSRWHTIHDPVVLDGLRLRCGPTLIQRRGPHRDDLAAVLCTRGGRCSSAAAPHLRGRGGSVAAGGSQCRCSYSRARSRSRTRRRWIGGESCRRRDEPRCCEGWLF